MVSISDAAPLKLLVAMHASYFVLRARFIARAPSKQDWIETLREDAKALLEQIKLNPAKALAGTTISSDAVGTMGLQATKEGRHISPSIVDETANSINSQTIDDDLSARQEQDGQ